MSEVPNCGAGSRDTRKDAVRYGALFAINAVTRATCRDIWREWIEADDDSVKPLQDQVRDHEAHIRNIEEILMHLRAKVKALEEAPSPLPGGDRQ